MKRCRLKRLNFQIINKMNKENETSDKQQNGNDFIADVSARTDLKLLKIWDAPTHYFPIGTRGSALYFANVAGMSVEKFIEDYERGRFSGWFEPYVR